MMPGNAQVSNLSETKLRSVQAEAQKKTAPKGAVFVFAVGMQPTSMLCRHLHLRRLHLAA